VVQYTRLLDRSTSDYEITHLHENTNYEICVLRLHDDASPRPPTRKLGAAVALPRGPGGGGLSAAAVACVTGSTSTDSLSVALGSTFGAFLALGSTGDFL